MARWLFIVAGVACAAVVGVAAGDVPTPKLPAQAIAGSAVFAAPAVVASPELPPVDDPFPIRRVRATEGQLPQVQKQFEPGPLVRLPRADFEARVRVAGQVAAEAKQLPRIAESRFRRALVGGDLVGTAEPRDCASRGDLPDVRTRSVSARSGIGDVGDGRESRSSAFSAEERFPRRS
ncbi:MAG: hypothetical protein U0792_09280 [Gemmataceae bacterium]